MALTDTQIRNAKPKDKPYKLADSAGLFLLVQPSSGKLWRVKYRVGTSEKKLGLGTTQKGMGVRGVCPSHVPYLPSTHPKNPQPARSCQSITAR